MRMPSGIDAWIFGNSSWTSRDTVSGLAAGVGKTPMNVPWLPLKVTLTSVEARRQLDPGDVAEVHHLVALRGDRQGAEAHRIGERRLHLDAVGDEVVLGAARRRQEIRAVDGGDHVGGGDAVGGHQHRIEPDAHRIGLGAEELRLGDAVDGGEARLDDARQVLAHLGRRHLLALDREVHERELEAGALLDDRIEGIRGQLVAHLLHLGDDLGQRLVGIGVEEHVHLDGAHPERRGRGDVVGALR